MSWVSVRMWVFVFFCLVAVQATGDVIFNCNRGTQNCEHAGHCDVPTGLCACRFPFIGYACHINVYEYSPGPPCSLQCQNGGTCMTDDRKLRPDFCACPSDVMGPRCEQTRVSVSCSGTSMTFTFRPIQPYWGVAYVGETSDVTACRLRGRSDFMAETQRQSIPLDKSCNGSVEVDALTGDVVHRRHLHVQYNSLIINDLDLVYDVTCVHTTRAVTKTGQVNVQSAGVAEETGEANNLVVAKATQTPDALQKNQQATDVQLSDHQLLGNARRLTGDNETVSDVTVTGGAGSDVTSEREEFIVLVKLRPAGSHLTSRAVTFAMTPAVTFTVTPVTVALSVWGWWLAGNL